MKKKLLLELEEAGFPTPKGIIKREFNNEPTLSEIIKELPKQIYAPNLNKGVNPKEVPHLFRLGWGGDEWFATYEFYESYIKQCGTGKTPEEAVANLWLKINKEI